jgi:hypothetical protein
MSAKAEGAVFRDFPVRGSVRAAGVGEAEVLPPKGGVACLELTQDGVWKGMEAISLPCIRACVDG